MKKQTDKRDDKKKLAEKAIERWENEGGEVLEIESLRNTKVVEERRKVTAAMPRTTSMSEN